MHRNYIYFSDVFSRPVFFSSNFQIASLLSINTYPLRPNHLRVLPVPRSTIVLSPNVSFLSPPEEFENPQQRGLLNKSRVENIMVHAFFLSQHELSADLSTLVGA